MHQPSARALCWAASCLVPVLGLAAGCGDDGGNPVEMDAGVVDSGPQVSLDDFLPGVPAPTGEPQSVWAGPITLDNADERIDGPAASGMIGDFFMRNARGRYVIQAPTRVIGVVPQGGNLVDAVPLAADGSDASADHFGELSFVYLLGRTCEHTAIEVVQDGSGGGAAVLRARGKTSNNDFINLRGVGIFDVERELNPDFDDQVECATTYVLEPDADHVQVHWTLVNPGSSNIRGPFGALGDTGGEVEVWGPTRGFERLGIEAIAGGGGKAPVEYVVYQGPQVAYGILPRHGNLALSNASFLIAGVSVILFGSDELLDIFDPSTYYLDLPAGGGVTHRVDVSVGHDAASAEAAFRAGRGEAIAEIAGTVSWASGAGAAGARVGVYEDVDGNGAVSADDLVRSYLDVAADGTFSGRVPAGNYLLRAEVKDLARSPVTSLELVATGATNLTMSLPEPVYIDYSVTDDQGNFIPARLTVLGRHLASPDYRLFETFDRIFGVVHTIHSMRGTTTDIGDGADAQLVLPAGGTYRIMASRGTEWSIDSQVITTEAGVPVAPLAFTLAHVAPADGYIASEYHVHQLGSPDSTVSNERRIASMLAEGVELFASTDHDFVSDLQPLIQDLGVQRHVRNIPGIEVTPFVYGHFNAWPVEPDVMSPNNGAIDWARGQNGYAMIPDEIFGAMRARGAELVQVNHPRSKNPAGTSFQQFFDRAGVIYDYELRQIHTTLGPVLNSWLRLPEVSLWSDSFNSLEVWNGVGVGDTNQDGVREITSMDLVMRDWFNFLSLGLVVTPIGSSDTHKAFSDAAGMPRTYVRVGNDAPETIESGTVVLDVLDTLAGQTARDVVLTNGPHILLSRAGESTSAIGETLAGDAGTISFDVRVLSPTWAAIDTIEVFANATPDVPSVASPIEVTALEPLYCFTTRAPADMAVNDVCAGAVGGPRPLDVSEVAVGASASRFEATVRITVNKDDIVNRAGASGEDAWLVFRARGSRAIFPLLMNGVNTEDTLDTLVSGDPAQVEEILATRGVPATAFTAPVFVDFDGGGYTAVFSPK